jgi:hypothetical protein
MHTRRASIIGALAVVSLPGYALMTTGAATAGRPAALAIRVTDEQVEFRAGQDLITRYHKGPGVAKPYFWPVHGPHGLRLTRAWPMERLQPGGSADHIHQKSMWFCHGDVIPEGVELKAKIKGVEGVDFWSEARGHGVIRCTAVDAPQTSGNRGVVDTKNEWLTADGTKIMDERRIISIYDFGAARLLVVDIDLHASVVPVTFGDTKEGSFGVRVNDVIREQKGNGKLENAEGKIGEKACWGQMSAWCDYSGSIDDKKVGIAILDDPSNPYRACWHSRGYGLMAANPFGRQESKFPAMKGRTDLVKLARGQHLKLRYGVLLHPGDAKEGGVSDHYERFVMLPRAEK